MFRLETLGGLDLKKDDQPLPTGPKPRRLALLAVLAVFGSKGARREQLLQIFWPDSEEERGRHALSQTLYNLRRDLGQDVVIATGADLRLDPSIITTDLDSFRRAIADGDWAGAAECYRGPFLRGFSLTDGPDFDRWVEQERATLTRDGLQAIERAAIEVTRTRGMAQSVRLWERLVANDPLSARYCLGLMEALAAAGDTPRALAQAKTHADLVRADLDTGPDLAITRFVEQLRRESREPARQPAASTVSSPPGPVGTGPIARRRFPIAVPILAAVGVVALALVAWRLRRPAIPARPELAVGVIRAIVPGDSLLSGPVLTDLLATSLGRVRGLEIVSPTRIYELLPQDADSARTAWATSARRAGARQLIEGEVSRSGAVYRFDARRVDLESGHVERGYRVTAADPFGLMDSLTVAISRDLDAGSSGDPEPEGGTRSPAAAAAYQEGLKAYFQYDVEGANRLFESALAADTGFALAAYYSWLTTAAESARSLRARLALRLSDHASVRDRMIIRADIGNAYFDRSATALADSLVARFPDDPEALLQAARLRIGRQPLDRVIPLLERAITIDSSIGAGRAGPCRLCLALSAMAGAYWAADSAPARERTLRRWTRLAPNDRGGWRGLIDLLAISGREPEAAAARAKWAEFGWPTDDPVIESQIVAIHQLDPALVERGCASLDSGATPPLQWSRRRRYCVIGLRALGRFREALQLTQNYRHGRHRSGVAVDSLSSIALDWEMGRPALAAAAFRRTADQAAATADPFPSARARTVAWNLTLAASAHLSGGDTAAARSLVDSIETIGRQSSDGRDGRLHHYVRAGLARAAGRQADAIAEYREAADSWVLGFNRINADLARALIEAAKPAEAAVLLRAALGGPIDGAGFFLTRTEIRALQAEAFDAAGMTDSAAAGYRMVERAWRAGDREVTPRHQRAREWLRQRGRPLAK